MMQQMWNRLRLIFAHGKGVIVRSGTVQVKVLAGEVLDNVRRIEPYGFSYRPKEGCEAYLLFPSGDRSYGVALVLGDERYQMDLLGGEVAIHDDEENWVHIKRGGVIEVKASTKVIIQAPIVRMETDRLEVTGDIVDRCGVGSHSMHSMRDVFNDHVHVENDNGGPTDPPTERME